MLIRIEGSDLPGPTFGPSPDRPGGYHNMHVAVQGRKGQQDLLRHVLPGQALARFPGFAAQAAR